MSRLAEHAILFDGVQYAYHMLRKDDDMSGARARLVTLLRKVADDMESGRVMPDGSKVSDRYRPDDLFE